MAKSSAESVVDRKESSDSSFVEFPLDAAESSSMTPKQSERKEASLKMMMSENQSRIETVKEEAAAKYSRENADQSERTKGMPKPLGNCKPILISVYDENNVQMFNQAITGVAFSAKPKPALQQQQQPTMLQTSNFYVECSSVYSTELLESESVRLKSLLAESKKKISVSFRSFYVVRRTQNPTSGGRA